MLKFADFKPNPITLFTHKHFEHKIMDDHNSVANSLSPLSSRDISSSSSPDKTPSGPVGRALTGRHHFDMTAARHLFPTHIELPPASPYVPQASVRSWQPLPNYPPSPFGALVRIFANFMSLVKTSFRLFYSISKITSDLISLNSALAAAPEPDGVPMVMEGRHRHLLVATITPLVQVANASFARIMASLANNIQVMFCVILRRTFWSAPFSDLMYAKSAVRPETLLTLEIIAPNWKKKKRCNWQYLSRSKRQRGKAMDKCVTKHAEIENNQVWNKTSITLNATITNFLLYKLRLCHWLFFKCFYSMCLFYRYYFTLRCRILWLPE